MPTIAAAVAAEADASASTTAANADATVVVALCAILGARRLLGGGFQGEAAFPYVGVGEGARIPFALGALCGLGINSVEPLLWFGVAGAGWMAKGGLWAWKAGFPGQTCSPRVDPVKADT